MFNKLNLWDTWTIMPMTTGILAHIKSSLRLASLVPPQSILQTRCIFDRTTHHHSKALTDSTMTSPLLRRSTRGRRPVECYSDKSGLVLCTHYCAGKESKPRQGVSLSTSTSSMASDRDGVFLAAAATPVSIKRRRLAKNHVTTTSSVAATPLIALSRKVCVTITPSSILSKKLAATPLMATISKQVSTTPISKKRRHHVRVSLTPSEALISPDISSATPLVATQVSAAAIPKKVQVTLTPSSIVPKKRTATPLVAVTSKQVPATPLPPKKRKRRHVTPATPAHPRSDQVVLVATPASSSKNKSSSTPCSNKKTPSPVNKKTPQSSSTTTLPLGTSPPMSGRGGDYAREKHGLATLAQSFYALLLVSNTLSVWTKS